MAINFPNSPQAGDPHSEAGINWVYDGEKWVAQSEATFWARAGSTLSPSTAGDNISTTGDLSVAAGTFSGDLTAGCTTTGTGGSSGEAKVVGYQQGIWIPTGLQGVQVISNFEWLRIGNQVTIAGALAGIATGNSGAFVVQGIPYANQQSGCKGACMSQGFSNPPTAVYVTSGGNQCEFYQSTNSVWTQATYNMLVATGAVYFTATYSTDDTTWTPINGATIS